VVSLLPLELDGSRTALDFESSQASVAPNRSVDTHSKCRHQQVVARGGPVVSEQEGLLDLLRHRQAGAPNPALSLHWRCELGASRVPQALAGRELQQFGGPVVLQGLRTSLRDREVQEVSANQYRSP